MFVLSDVRGGGGSVSPQVAGLFPNFDDGRSEHASEQPSPADEEANQAAEQATPGIESSQDVQIVSEKPAPNDDDVQVVSTRCQCPECQIPSAARGGQRSETTGEKPAKRRRCKTKTPDANATSRAAVPKSKPSSKAAVQDTVPSSRKAVRKSKPSSTAAVQEETVPSSAADVQEAAAEPSKIKAFVRHERTRSQWLARNKAGKYKVFSYRTGKHSQAEAEVFAWQWLE